MSNKSLNRARSAKNDEFYTLYEDIENKCQYYINEFKGKWIYLPCDSEQSNFWKYFVKNFNDYKLKKLTATHFSLDGKPSYRLDYNGTDIIKTALQGDGDFRSDECIKITDKCDLIITNPPFSLFRVFFKILTEKKKKFLIIGSANVITAKNVFPYIMNRDVFVIPNSQKLDFKMSFTNDKGDTVIVPCLWYSNFLSSRLYQKLELTKTYSPELYPKYDNYNAINVDKIKDIPKDYNGAMGAPITIALFSLDQIEIVDKCLFPYINGKGKYKRIIFKLKNSK